MIVTMVEIMAPIAMKNPLWSSIHSMPKKNQLNDRPVPIIKLPSDCAIFSKIKTLSSLIWSKFVLSGMIDYWLVIDT